MKIIDKTVKGETFSADELQTRKVYKEKDAEEFYVVTDEGNIVNLFTCVQYSADDFGPSVEFREVDCELIVKGYIE